MGKFSKRGGRGGSKGGNSGRNRGGRDRSDSRDGGRKNLKVERRDGSKSIKKGDGNPRKISLGQLRREQKNKGDKGGKPGRGGKGGGRRRFRDRKGGKKPMPKDPKERAELLDRDLENYWVKAGNKDLANERLNEDLDNYFKKNASEVVNGAAADKEVAKVAEEKKE